MQLTYSITDLTDFESDAVTVDLEKEQALGFALRVARAMLRELPQLRSRGMCVAVYDIEGVPISIVPLDPVQ